MKKIVILLTLSLMSGLSAVSLGPLDSFFPKIDSFEEFNNFALRLEKQLTALTEDRTRLEAQEAALKVKAEKLNSDILRMKAKTAEGSADEQRFKTQKLALLNQTNQTVTEMEQIIRQIISVLDTHTALLEEYRKDPEFKNKNLRLQTKSLYTFTDLQKINDLMMSQETELKDLEERAKKIQQDLTAREKALVIAGQEYAEKKKAQEEFKIRGQEAGGLTPVQQGKLIDMEEELYKEKLELAKLRLKEVEQKRNLLIDSQIKTSRLQLAIVKQEYEDIKDRLQVDEKYKKQVETEYSKDEQELEAKRKRYKEHVEALDSSRQSLEEQLTALKKQSNISNEDFDLIKQWDMQPNTVQGWLLFLTPQLLLRKRYETIINKNEAEAQLELDRAKLKQLEVQKMMVGTWYKRTTIETEDTPEELAQEIKQYERLREDVQASITSLDEKRTAAGVNLNSNSNLVEKIKARLKELDKQKDTIFKGYEKQYDQDYSRLKIAIDDARSLGEPLARNVELYSQALELKTNMLQRIEHMIGELQAVAQAKGSPSAVFKSLQDFFPDIVRFFKVTAGIMGDFIREVKNFSLSTMLSQNLQDPLHFLYFLSQFLIILLLFWLSKLYLPYFRSSLLSAAYSSGSSMGKILSQILYVFCGYLNTYLLPLYVWTVALVAIKTIGADWPAVRIGFYLLSIPFLLYYAYQFISYLRFYNRDHESRVVSKSFAEKMIKVFSFLLYSTIPLQLFREAFITVNYHKSIVPLLLQATNFALFQICLILLMGRNELLSLIPQTNGWQKLYDFINRYYYLLLLLVIIIVFMTNPYLGYGPHFIKLLARIIIIALLVPIFSALHNQIKRLFTSFFFQYDNDVIKDRFQHAKTAYGLFVIVSFAFFVLLGSIIALYIWGYSFGWRDISSWLHKELYTAGVDASGKTIVIEPINFIKLLVYVATGFAVSYVFNKFILRRVFELLLVNLGVQNALTSLSKYIIVIAFTVIGFQAVGMGSALLYIFAVLGAVGYAAKEIVTDFIAYIIILIQRFVKIGDFIQIDEDTRGIVRHINFRSVIVRQRNSVMVVIPNNYFISQKVINWNYSRTFFAFDDIFMVVSYTADPQEVKDIIAKTLSSNSNILKTPAPVILLKDFVENGFQFLIRGYLSSEKVLEQFDIASEFRFDLVRNLRAAGINLATPIRTIKVVEDEGAIKAAQNKIKNSNLAVEE